MSLSFSLFVCCSLSDLVLNSLIKDFDKGKIPPVWYGKHPWLLAECLDYSGIC